MSDEEKNRGGGRLTEENRAWETTFIMEAAEELAKEMTEGTDKEIRYDSESKRWVYQDRTEVTAFSAAYVEEFCRELEQFRKNKVRGTRYTRNYRDEVTELMEDVWSLREWIKQSVEGEI